MSMNIFQRIPEAHQVSILTEWLSMKDFARLDLAICRLEGRIELHSLMHLQHCAFAWLGVELDDVVARWMIAHNLRCREVSLSQELLRNRPLRKQLFSQMGNSVECVNTWSSLQHLTLTRVLLLPRVFLHDILSKVQHLTLESCTVEGGLSTTSQLPLIRSELTFESNDTPLPTSLCAYVTSLSMAKLMDDDRTEQLIPSYMNLREANLTFGCLTIGNDIPQLIGQYWRTLVVLRLSGFDYRNYNNKLVVSEEQTLMLIRLLPTLRLLVTVEISYNIDYNRTIANVYLRPDPSTSQLQTLRMYCDKQDTLKTVLQLCPQLATLYLMQPTRQEGRKTTLYVPVEKALSLVHNSSVRSLHLFGYDSLSNADLAALQNSVLHTLSIDKAGNQLTDDAIVALIPTLTQLHTLDLSSCTNLSQDLVLSVPPLCLSLRSFSFSKVFHTCCGNESTSYSLFEAILPRLFPHVKTFCIEC